MDIKFAPDLTDGQAIPCLAFSCVRVLSSCLNEQFMALEKLPRNVNYQSNESCYYQSKIKYCCKKNMQSVGATEIIDSLFPLAHAEMARQNDSHEFS